MPAIYWVMQTVAKAAADGAMKRSEASLTRETETHKLRLKKQEILFGKELDAVLEFIKIRHDLKPKVDDPTMDGYEAGRDFAMRLGQVERVLDDFMAKHSGPISDKARAHLKKALDLTRYNKFRITNGEPDKVAEEAAEDLLMELLPTIERQFLEDIRVQSGLPVPAAAP